MGAPRWPGPTHLDRQGEGAWPATQGRLHRSLDLGRGLRLRGSVRRLTADADAGGRSRPGDQGRRARSSNPDQSGGLDAGRPGVGSWLDAPHRLTTRVAIAANWAATDTVRDCFGAVAGSNAFCEEDRSRPNTRTLSIMAHVGFPAGTADLKSRTFENHPRPGGRAASRHGSAKAAARFIDAPTEWLAGQPHREPILRPQCLASERPPGCVSGRTFPATARRDWRRTMQSGAERLRRQERL